ncbi:glutaredoxin, partial [Conglomerata obtusa]
MSDDNDFYSDTFKELENYDSIIAYTTDLDIPQKFIQEAEPNYVTIDLTNTKLRNAFFQYSKITDLPCLLTAKIPCYDNQDFESAIQSAKTKVYNETIEKINSMLSQNKNFIFIKGTPSRPECKFTRKLVELLQQKGLVSGRDFGYCNIFENEKIRQSIKKLNNWQTFPQIYLDGKFLGGIDVLLEMDDEG